MGRATANPCASAWRSVARYGLAVILISALLSLAVLPWTGLSWWRVFRRCVSIAAALSLWLFIRRIERRSFGSYGLQHLREGARHLRWGVVFGGLGLGLLFACGLASGMVRIAITQDHGKLLATLIGFLPVAALVGTLEELVFRGFILQHLAACSKMLGVVVSSSLYALVHVKTAEFTPALGRELVGLFLLGGVLALSYLVTGRLWLAIGLHATLAYGARVNKLLIEFTDSSVAWLAGTSRLVNGVAAWLMLLALGGAIVWWARSLHGGGVHVGKT